MCFVARGPRFFKWKMLRESGPHALLFFLTTLDCAGDLVAGERFHFLLGHPLHILTHPTSPSRRRVLAQLRIGELTAETVGYQLG